MEGLVKVSETRLMSIRGTQYLLLKDIVKKKVVTEELTKATIWQMPDEPDLFVVEFTKEES